jgi:hypothetical protein
MSTSAAVLQALVYLFIALGAAVSMGLLLYTTKVNMRRPLGRRVWSLMIVRILIILSWAVAFAAVLEGEIIHRQDIQLIALVIMIVMLLCFGVAVSVR